MPRATLEDAITTFAFYFDFEIRRDMDYLEDQFSSHNIDLVITKSQQTDLDDELIGVRTAILFLLLKNKYENNTCEKFTKLFTDTAIKYNKYKLAEFNNQYICNMEVYSMTQNNVIEVLHIIFITNVACILDIDEDMLNSIVPIERLENIYKEYLKKLIEIETSEINRMRWKKSLFVTMLSVLVFAVVGLLYNSISSFVFYKPFIFDLFWEILAVIIVCRLLKLYKINISSFVCGTVIIGLIAGATFYILPKPSEYLNYPYYGVATKFYYDGIDSVIKPDDIYNDYQKSNIISARYKSELKRFSKLSDKSLAKLTGYYYWETGAANGYSPRVDTYYKSGISNKVKLFITVGPLALAETIFIGILDYYLLFLLITYCYYFYFKEQIWDDIAEKLGYSS